jgi:hypothetical protein
MNKSERVILLNEPCEPLLRIRLGGTCTFRPVSATRRKRKVRLARSPRVPCASNDSMPISGDGAVASGFWMSNFVPRAVTPGKADTSREARETSALKCFSRTSMRRVRRLVWNGGQRARTSAHPKRVSAPASNRRFTLSLYSTFEPRSPHVTWLAHISPALTATVPPQRRTGEAALCHPGRCRGCEGGCHRRSDSNPGPDGWPIL